MKKIRDKTKTTERLRNEAKIGGELPGRNISEQEDIEQTRLENRREADLEDKTPAGDAGVEDSFDDQRRGRSREENIY
ncbi:MAG TPA: hypothetical protein VGI82_14690 [Chitinophagaceae bacterium]